MPATVAQLAGTRSSLALELLEYLDSLAKYAARLPHYYPAHLRTSGDAGFDRIRQLVQVVEDREELARMAAELERQRSAGRNDEPYRHRKAHKARPELDGGEGDDEERTREDEPDLPSTVPWDEHTARRYPRVVILGDPGFGKTTLLRGEARRLARAAWSQIDGRTASLDAVVLPILQRLPDLAGDLSLDAKPLETILLDRVAGRRSSRFRDYLEKKLHSGACVILLDAWDEAPDKSRKRLRQALGDFSTRYPNPSLRLASRIVGYGSNPIPESIELELVAWDTPQVESFVRAWFATPGDGDQFLATVRTTPQVQGLVRVPLMLALLCKAYQQKRLRLPARRVDLYDQCLRGLLGDWKREEEGDDPRSRARINAALEVLGPVALELFAAGHAKFSVDLLRDKLLCCLEELAKQQPFHESLRETPETLIEGWIRDGVLIRSGDDAESDLLFPHLTLHESLAAAALAKSANGPGRWPAVETRVDKHAGPQWREVITLLAGGLADPAPLLQLLLDPAKDDLCRSRLGLAMTCLGEMTEEVRGKPAVKQLIDDIAQAGWRLCLEHMRAGTDPLLVPLQRGLPGLAAANGEVEPGRPVLGVAAERVISGPDRLAALAMLGMMGGAAAAHSGVLESLVKCLRDESSWVIREAAAQALRSMGVRAATDDVVAGLMQASLRDGAGEVRRAAAEALGRMAGAAAAGELHGELLRLLAAGGPDATRAIEALGNIGRPAATPPVLAALVDRLRNCRDEEKKASTDALGRMGAEAATRDVLEGLRARLMDNSLHSWDRGGAARALGRLGGAAATETVVQDLVACLDSDCGDEAAGALGRMGASAATAPALAGLVKLLASAGRNGNAAATALARMGRKAGVAEVTEQLRRSLHNPDCWLEAAEALARVGGTAETREAVSRIEAALLDRDAFERWADAAEALGRIGGRASPRVVAHLTSCLNGASGLADIAAEALGRIAPPDRAVVSSLLQCLGEPGKQDFVLAAVARALGRMAGAAAPAVAAAASGMVGGLRQCLGRPELQVRQAAAEALARITESGVSVPFRQGASESAGPSSGVSRPSRKGEGR